MKEKSAMKNNLIHGFVAALILMVGTVWGGSAAAPAELDRYNVVWETPSKDSAGTMPIGNGDVGLNVWAEPDGDLLFYIGKTDAWDAGQQLLKLGRVRVALSPNPFVAGKPFRQELELRNGRITIRAGEAGQTVVLRVWVDANRPAVYVEVDSEKPVDLQATLESWRKDERVEVAPGDKGILWYHRNSSSILANTLEHQGLASLAGLVSDPLLNRTFGGLLTGDGLRPEGKASVKSAEPRKAWQITAHILSRQSPSPEAWQGELLAQAATTDAVPGEQARREHEAWWGDFWQRSWIRVSGGEGEETEKISLGWHLYRFMTACQARGAYPIKFNGGIFTVDGSHGQKKDVREHSLSKGNILSYDADFRYWGGCYWFQNTRLLYWPMLAAGDTDMMRPLFEMYRNMLSFAQGRTKLWYGHEGAFFQETFHLWGSCPNDNYGRIPASGRPKEELGLVTNRYIRYYWQSGLELSEMLLEYYRHTGDEATAKQTLVPLADAVTLFYDRHYQRGADGKLYISPSNALETWWDVSNPICVVGGLHRVLAGLLALPNSFATTEQRQRWQQMRGELPEIPLKEGNGGDIIASYSEIRDPVIHNGENPNLYPVFPYRLYGVGKPDLELARRTYEQRANRWPRRCWNQDPIFAACLGLTEDARTGLAERITAHGYYRFPIYYNSDLDWEPDLDNGGAASMTLLSMLMQADGRKILLLPAWPKEWDVEFKLHAPFQTTVEGVFRNGKMEKLTVLPESRKADVVFPVEPEKEFSENTK